MVNDTLGTGLKQRARESRAIAEQEEADQYNQILQQYPGAGLYGPMRMPGGKRMETVSRDPQWEGFFQAMQEQGVDKVGFGAPFGPGGAALSGLRQAKPRTTERRVTPAPWHGMQSPQRRPNTPYDQQQLDKSKKDTASSRDIYKQKPTGY